MPRTEKCSHEITQNVGIGVTNSKLLTDKITQNVGIGVTHSKSLTDNKIT